MMVGMKTPLDTKDDTEAICLFSSSANGALCAGITYNGSSIVAWSNWYTAGSFTLATNSNALPSGGVDQSAEWFATDAVGKAAFKADGSNDSYWSVFKF